MDFLLNIKPLSVNEAWQGRRFKTKKYLAYEKHLLFILPLRMDKKPPFELNITFGITVLSDIDNPLKPFLDLLQKKYEINDRDIMKITVVKQVVKTGSEFIKFKISEYTEKVKQL